MLPRTVRTMGRITVNGTGVTSHVLVRCRKPNVPITDTARETVNPTTAAVAGTFSRAAVPHARDRARSPSPRKRAFWNGSGVRGMLRKLNAATQIDRIRLMLRRTSPTVWEMGRTGSRFTDHPVVEGQGGDSR